MITARQNIFDIIQNNYDIAREINKINDIINRLEVGLDDVEGFGYGFFNSENLYKWVEDNCFPKWKNRGVMLDIEEFEDILGIEDIILNAEREMIAPEDALIYLEYILNIIYMCLNSDAYKNNELKIDEKYSILMEVINNLLDNLNYEIKYFENEEKVLLVEKNATATAVAEISDEKTALEVLEYNHYLLKGNIEKKRAILKSITDVVEGHRTNQKNSGVLSDYGYLVNNLNIRHNNFDGSKKQPYLISMTDEELEQWYDITYQIILICILQNEYDSNLKEEISALKKTMPHK